MPASCSVNGNGNVNGVVIIYNVIKLRINLLKTSISGNLIYVARILYELSLT